MVLTRLAFKRHITASVAVLISIWALSVSVRTYLTEVEEAPSDYKLADWLISYQAGPIRRGLTGEAFTALSDASAITLGTVAFQVSLYVIIFTSALMLFFQTSMSWPWIALTLSPAFLLFPYLQIAGSFRKEILGLASVALLALAVRNRNTRSIPSWLLPISALLLIIAVFSHEVNVIAVPIWIWLVHTHFGGHSIAKWLLRLTIVLITSALLFALTFPGSIEQRVAICRDLMEAGFNEAICYGSISYIGSSWVTELDRVLTSWPAYLGYVLILALALAPLAQVRFLTRFWMPSAATALVAVPFFLLGLDYGRWIAFAVSVLSFAALSLSPGLNRTLLRLPWFIYVIFLISWSPTYFGPPFPTESLITKLL